MKIERTNNIIASDITRWKDMNEILYEHSSCFSFHIAVEDDNWWAYGGVETFGGKAVAAYLGPTYVKEEFRNRGLQKALIAARLDYVRGLGYPYAVSCVYSNNSISGNNLIKTGFELMNYKLFKKEPVSGQIWFQKKL